MDIFSNINWLAVVIGWFISYALGALWFSPALFLKPWVGGMGEVKVKWPLPLLMAVQAVSSFIFAIALALALNYSFVLAVTIALAVAGMVKTFAFYSGKTIKSTAVETSYIIVQAVIVIATIILMK